MKHNYSQQQYEQLAKEQFYQILNKIPFVSDIEINDCHNNNSFGDFYAVVHYVDTLETERFCIEVKSNGEKRYVNMFINQVSLNNNVCYIFMAPYISESSAQSMINNQCSYMDLSGNCYILSKRIILHYQGKENKFLFTKDKKQYFLKSSTATSVIMRTILDKPETYWKVKDLSKITDKAIGTVSNVKSFLKERDFIDEFPSGFKIKNIKELLYSWAKDYHKKDSISYEYYSFDKISELEKKISIWSSSHDKSALLGGFSAAARFSPTVRYNKIFVYVELQALNEFIKDLNLKPVETGGNVIITIPHDETPYMFSREINGDYITSVVQTVLDLLGNSTRGEEAADAIILKEYKE